MLLKSTFVTILNLSIIISEVAALSIPTTAATTTTKTTTATITEKNSNHKNVRIQTSSDQSILEGTTTTATMGNIDISKAIETSSVLKKEKNKFPTMAKITKLESAEDYMDFLLEDDRLCMVKFYAPTCKSCQKMGMHYKRIGKEIGDLVSSSAEKEDVVVRDGEMRLAEIDYSTNKELCQRLGVTKLPSIHIYSEGKKVDGFPCGPRKLPMLLSKLSEYRSMSPIDLSFEADMNQGMELGETVLEALDCEVASAAAATNAGAFC